MEQKNRAGRPKKNAAAKTGGKTGLIFHFNPLFTTYKLIIR